MEKFTQLGLSNKPEVKPSPNVSVPAPKTPATPKKPSGGKKVAAFVASSVAGSLLAIFLLQTGGCSKEKTSSTIASPQVPISQAPAPSTSAPSPAAAQAVAESPKKVVKRRPTTVAYNNQDYGVTFRYPKRYVLKTADNTKQDAAGSDPFGMNFVQPGGIQVASVELPAHAFPGTDLALASFNINANKAVTEEQCSQFALLQLASSDDLAVQPTRMKLGGLDLEEMEAISGSQDKQVDAKYYHRFENGTCYEFALGLTTQSGDREDGMMPVDRAEVFHRLERILATVKINPELPTPEIPATAAAPASVPPTTAAPAATPSASQDIAVKQ